MTDLVFVTSWDDGNALDMRLADLLTRIGVSGTFYISRSTCGLSDPELRTLSERHEIGSHTSSHAVLGTIPLQKWLSDVRDGKSWLEDVIGRAVPAFAYPKGAFTSGAASELHGIVGSARTTLLGATSLRVPDPFLLHTTVHAHSFPVWHRMSGLLKGRWSSRPPWALLDWTKQLEAAASSSTARVVHLWGHSWEIDEGDLWVPLEKSLRELADIATSALTVTEFVERGSDAPQA